MLKNKYIKYTPEITLEVFKLIWNKLVESGLNPSFDFAYTEYIRFSSNMNYLILEKDGSFGAHSVHHIYQTETTVQEILGYDPFVKDDFVLPEKWYIAVNEENVDAISQWRTTGWCSASGYCVNKVGSSNDAGWWFHSIPDGYTEITFDQFKKHVLKQFIEETKTMEKDWTKATKEELLAEAKRRYPIGTKFISPKTFKCKTEAGIGNVVPNNNFYYEFGKISAPDMYYIYENGKWAEIISLPETKVESKEIVPKYVECIGLSESTIVSWSHKCEIGKIYEAKDSSNTLYCIGNYYCPKDQFKISSKEAFDAQNKPKSIEKWSVGSYVVFCKKYIGNSKIGKISKITESLNHKWFISCKEYGSLDITREGDGEIKWFATKSEAEEFAKILIQPVKDEYTINMPKEMIKPLKQAVHCRTQEEWDFACDKLKRSSKVGFEGLGDFIKTDYPDCSFLATAPDYDYQILSFQKWCDLNGYKMEKKCEFKVGDWVKLISNNTDSCNKVGDVGIVTNVSDIDVKVEVSADKNQGNYSSFRDVRHATPAEIMNHLSSIGLDAIPNFPIRNRSTDDLSNYGLPTEPPSSMHEFEGLENMSITELHENGLVKGFFTNVIGSHKVICKGNLCSFDKFRGKKCDGVSCGNCLLSDGNRHKLDDLLGCSVISNTYANPNTLKDVVVLESWPPKMTLSIDDEDLPMVSVIKTNSIKQLLNNN